MNNQASLDKAEDSVHTCIDIFEKCVLLKYFFFYMSGMIIV